jgi:Putative peptidoglycan binding domain
VPSTSLSDFFRGLFGHVGDGRENRPDDVLRVKTAMRRLGYYDSPSYGMTGYADRDLDDGIRAYQEQNGLRADGWMQPDGPTYRRLAADLGTVVGARTGWPPIPKLKQDRERPTLFPLSANQGAKTGGVTAGSMRGEMGAHEGTKGSTSRSLPEAGCRAR